MGCQVLAPVCGARTVWLHHGSGGPDNETVAHLSVDLASRGTVKIQTLPAVPLDSFINKLKSHEQLAGAQSRRADLPRLSRSRVRGRLSTASADGETRVCVRTVLVGRPGGFLLLRENSRPSRRRHPFG